MKIVRRLPGNRGKPAKHMRADPARDRHRPQENALGNAEDHGAGGNTDGEGDDD